MRAGDFVKSDNTNVVNGLPPGGGVRLARRRHAPAACCPDLVVRHRALFPVAMSRRLATVK
jgi:hypothetical protein